MKLKRCICITFILVSNLFYIQAQKEAYNWFFGYNSGLTWKTTRSLPAVGLFSTAPNTTLDNLPDFVAGSKIQTHEGCFSLSDSKGDLLFYSDGMTIWDKEHGVMENGTGLTGDNSSAQSGIILPYPGHPNQYIAVSIKLTTGNLAAYSIVDMNQNDRLGKVITKNIQFTGHSGVVGESVSSIRHANGKDYWIVAPGRGTSSYFNAWKVTSEGVQNTSPVITPIGTDVSATNNGYLKFTPDGKHFVWGTWHAKKMFIGDFDTNTGLFSNITEFPISAYGIEFSASGKYLYFTDNSSTIYAYDFAALLSNPATVPVTYSQKIYGAFQLAPDGRIYMAHYTGSNTAAYVIDNPEEYPDLKIYRIDGFLPNDHFRMGLPSFAANWFAITIEGAQSLCVNTTESYAITLSQSSDTDEIAYTEWDFGDGGSFLKDTNVSSGTQTHSHTYTKPGLYNITVRSYLANGMEAASETITVKVNPCVLPVNPNVHLFN
ncbi:PKD domain-containing protein [Parabacteroides sp. PF5-9]|uniref:PKD domain-containing protein n=1 Tax=Parabacteroides sp. PF5-9 TaxID=1742404 RepID=UPI0024739D72|nr:PKD domain-containing protein [Parabacteroides sp. PF5-9]MDH6358703.1 PKD repeat protein [Parabacteroides sp. PF5-9]